MYKIFILLIFLIVEISNAQVPLWGSRSNGAPCTVQTLNNSDSSRTAQFYWYPSQATFTGAATLCGSMRLSAGTDTLVSIRARLIMRSSSSITTTSMLYDSMSYHTIAKQSGDALPIENGVTSTITPFSIDLALREWWRPSIGIELTFIMNGCAGLDAKEIEAYIIRTDFKQN